MAGRSARRAVALLLVVAGCGARTRGTHPVPAPPVVAPPDAALTATPRAAPPAAPLPTFEVLAARQVRLAPGMRRARSRRDRGVGSASPTDRDTCVRVAFVASRPVTAALVSKDGAILERSAATEDGALGVRGPVCFHPGTQPRLQVEGDAGVVRYVVWGAP